MESKITKHYFEYAGNKYFRGNAYAVDLAAFGEKKDPVGAKAHIDVQGHVAAKNLEGCVRNTTTAKVDWSQFSQADVEAEGALKIFGVKGKAAVSGNYEQARSARLELINFTIDETPLKKMLNDDAAAARKFLADEGNDGRIVSEVWVVAEGELAEQFATSGSLSVAAGKTGKGLEVTATGGKSGAVTILLEEGTAFAYRLHKVKNWKNGKTEIENMEADFKGMG